MATTAFSALSPEIHEMIAKNCENNDLLNLCLTSKLVNDRCSRVLYHHVDLLFDEYGLGDMSDEEFIEMWEDLVKRQQQFTRALLSHPEYARHVRIFKGRLGTASLEDCNNVGEEMISEEDFWRAMQSLTHVRSVEVAARTTVPTMQFPNDLFHSATSLRLVGHMPYGLAKSILNAINPATLKHLCVDMVQDCQTGQGEILPGKKGEGGRIITFGVMSGLLTTLTGRCTALRTLILRRVGQIPDGYDRNEAADEASYLEWASFIRSVQGTVENFRFELTDYWVTALFCLGTCIDMRFRRLVLSAPVSGNWPCLATIELRGLMDSNVEGEKDALTAELRAAVGENPRIVVEDEARPIDEPYCWN